MTESQSSLDLPDAVLELGRRLGANENKRGLVKLRQSGSLRSLAGSRWIRFSAYQTISILKPSFSWKAKVGPFGVLRVRDELLDGHPAGSVNLGGCITVTRAAPSPELLKGELLRYLAELPWAPDAIFCNHHLSWSVPIDGKLTVSAHIDEVFGEVTFLLNADGLISRVDATDRPSLEGKIFIERPWHGTFEDYREVDGYTIPYSARVGWNVDETIVTVWRGNLDHWKMAAVAS